MNSSNTRTWIGAIIIVIGLLLLADNFIIFPFNFPLQHLIFSWHTFFIIIGAVIISNHNKSFWGYLLLGIGIVGILRHFPELPFFEFLTFHDLWPLILLVLGLWMILNHREKQIHHDNSTGTDANQNFSFGGKMYSEQPFDIINVDAIFTTLRRVVTSQNFKGGKITSLFGSVKLDLTQAKLAPGENILDVTAIFGGVDIRVPKEMKVVMNVSAVFGGYEDKRFLNLDAPPKDDACLIIKGAVIFGGGQLSN